jgi:phage shock protein C
MSISRPREARMIAGVCAALARRYGMPLFLVRVLTVAAGIAGFGLIVYTPTSWNAQAIEAGTGTAPRLRLTSSAPHPSQAPIRKPMEGPEPEPRGRALHRR